ncbi:glycine cleavage system aminomethyltransferase GcvT [Rhodopila sp.]|uniref:glycine cleavage system aminomethyltransferase GcvT n=1 Tax=Rhodopila sp. TaxID=2480087 RepID=UPI002CF97351|nr:glycine cleavage system aminomethyltransferase GcvT [Rhodopila sp.]HVZ08709.1 glycine cleavage system aminomethyltransferase GcvT [Rhodopila sp.]
MPVEPASTGLRTTPLTDWHRRHGARLVPFAGYTMPVQYDFSGDLTERCRGGVLAEHLHTRAKAGLFDVSHMGQALLRGGGAAAALERLVPGDILGLKPGRQRYTLLLNDAGGIVDDLMVARLDDATLFLVVNAGRKHIDLPLIAADLPAGVALLPQPDRALLALQGPAAVTVMARLAPAAAGLPFMGIAVLAVDGIDCIVSRSGYTGEDGFEVSVPAADAVRLADRLVAEPEVVPIGLGARDSLRLEAGLCLYGNDLDETTSPVEAGLTWVIGKRRRIDWDFPGAVVVRDHLDNGPPRRRVGIRPDGRAPARAHTDIVAGDGSQAGVVTSGGFGPSVNAPVAMGYVRRDLAADGTRLTLTVRGKALPAAVAPLPFVPHRYIR